MQSISFTLEKCSKTVHQYEMQFKGEFGQVRDRIIIEATWVGNRVINYC